MSWTSPTGWSDPNSGWINETYSFNDLLSNHGDATGTGKYLIWTHSSISCNKIRIGIYTTNDASPNCSIDVYYGSDWHNIHSGPIPSGHFYTEKDLGSTQTVTQARICWLGEDGLGYMGVRDFDFGLFEGLTISDVGAIASAEAFGTPKANLNLAPSAIASLEAIGAPQLNFLLALAGVASGEAFGTPKVSLGFTLFPDGITSLEAFGASIVAGPLILTGISSGEAIGSPAMVISISAIGIASEEAVGEPKLNLTLFPAGIATAEALGIPQLNLVVFPSGAESGEAFGVLIIAGPLILTGIESEEAFGSAAVSLGLTLLPSGIPSEEAVGTPVVKFVWVAPSGLRYIVELHDSSGNLEAILENAYNISFTEALNEAPLLEFSIPADEEKISGVSRLGEIWLRDYETGEVVKKFLLHLERDIRT